MLTERWPFAHDVDFAGGWPFAHDRCPIQAAGHEGGPEWPLAHVQREEGP